MHMFTCIYSVVNNRNNELTEGQTHSSNSMLVAINDHDITNTRFPPSDISDSIDQHSFLCYFSFYMICDIRYVCLWVSLTLQVLIRTSKWYTIELLRKNSNNYSQAKRGV